MQIFLLQNTIIKQGDSNLSKFIFHHLHLHLFTYQNLNCKTTLKMLIHFYKFAKCNYKI